MNLNVVMQHAKDACQKDMPYKALNLLKHNPINTKDYYVLMGDIYMMLSCFKEAEKSYRSAVTAYAKEASDRSDMIRLKSEMNHKIMDAMKLSSFVRQIEAQYLYEDDNYFFIDLDTYESIEVPKNIVKYVQLKESEEYILVLDTRTDSVINVIEKES